MGYFRLFRRMHLAPGLTVNLAKSGPSLSLGVRGAHVTVGSSGIRKTVGLPGTGCYYTSQQGWHSGAHTAPHFTSATPAQPVQRSGWQTTGDALAATVEILGTVIATVLGILLIFATASGSKRRSRF